MIKVVEFAARETLLLLILGYRVLISQFMPRTCRFEPSCSRYAYEAISRYGVLKGCNLALRRLLRCRPGGGSGFDPVP